VGLINLHFANREDDMADNSAVIKSTINQVVNAHKDGKITALQVKKLIWHYYQRMIGASIKMMHDTDGEQHKKYILNSMLYSIHMDALEKINGAET
jgi:hypothetical protein